MSRKTQSQQKGSPTLAFPRATDLVRVTLGAVLLVAGFWFLAHLEAFAGSIRESGFPFAAFVLAHGIVLAHLGGGALLLVGLLSRVAALFQIPILLGALAMVNFDGGLLAASSPLVTGATLGLAIAIAILGDGEWSLAAWFRSSDEAALTAPMW